MAGLLRTAAAFGLALLAPPVAAAPGALLIAGGALSTGNAAVHRALLDRRPSDRPLVAIIPSASGAPVESAAAFAQALIPAGASPEELVVVHLASEDDPSTPGVDERRWAANASNPVEIAKIAAAGAIWFTGGDQLRTTRLLAPGGRETPMLAAIRARLAAGAVVGGSSAGAAIMGRQMITGGEALPALLLPPRRQAEPDNRAAGSGLVMGDGLGFLGIGLVDQHFDARRRLGRLARALFELPPPARIGFGIDEDTALLADLASGEAEVLGRGSVALIDARGASRLPGGPFGAIGMRLGVASAGDRLDLATLKPVPSRRRQPVAPVAPPPEVPADSGGMAVPEPPLAELLADALFRDGARSHLDRPSLKGSRGVVFRFRRLPGAAAFAGGGTTLSGIGFEIRPFPPGKRTGQE